MPWWALCPRTRRGDPPFNPFNVWFLGICACAFVLESGRLIAGESTGERGLAISKTDAMLQIADARDFSPHRAGHRVVGYRCDCGVIAPKFQLPKAYVNIDIYN